MSPLDLAVKLIKAFEGCKLQAYRDIVGIWTVGYGETLGVKPGDVWTQDQAEARLTARVQDFLNGVILACPALRASTPNQLAACTSLAYNIGVKAFANSTVCKRLSAGDRAGAADAILMWNQAGGRIVQGLVNRRQEERRVFLSAQM